MQKVKNGLSGEAKKIYLNILEKFPKNKKAIVGVNSLNAKSVVTNSDKEDPPQQQMKSLVKLYEEGKLDAALEYSEILVRKFPSSAILFNLQGSILQSSNNFESSLNAYRKAISILSNFPEAYFNMGNLLKKLGNLDQAIEAFSKAISIRPDFFEAYTNMGNALKDQERFQAALEAHEQALSIKPNFAEAHYNKGNVLKAQGKLDEAIVAFKQVLKFDKQDIFGASLQLASITNDKIPDKTPEEFLRAFYAKKADTWNDKAFEKAGYNGNILIKKAYEQVSKYQNRIDILDLGCGTGTLASFLRPYARKLNGVDISPEMIVRAKENRLYDNIFTEDIEYHLKYNSTNYDVVIAAAVIFHFSKLDTIFALITKRLRKDGLFIFSVFEDNKADNSLNSFLMYSHSSQYIESLADNLGCKIVYQEKGIHEYHKHTSVEAVVYVFEK